MRWRKLVALRGKRKADYIDGASRPKLDKCITEVKYPILRKHQDKGQNLKFTFSISFGSGENIEP